MEKLLEEARRRGDKKLTEWLLSAQTSADDLLRATLRKAEEEAAQIIARAKKEAERILAPANKNAAVAPKTLEEESSDHRYPLLTGSVEAVAIYCGDHRFQKATAMFLDEEMFPTGNFHPIVMPGGSQMLTFGDDLPKFSNSLLRPLKFLVKHAAPSRVVVIAHQDCRWYADFVPSFMAIKGSVEDRQEEDLRLVRRLIGEIFPGAQVELYYAKIVEGQQVEFKTIT